MVQNIADCFLGRDEFPKDSESHDDVDRFDAIAIKIRNGVCPRTERIPVRKNRCHFRNLQLVHVSSPRPLTDSAFSGGEANEATEPFVATPRYTPNLKIKSL